MVFQEQGVFPWMTVLDNAAFGLTARGVPRREARMSARVNVYASSASRRSSAAYPRQLSGGMRQRVNLARAFVNDPAVLLMDEPLGALDEQTKMLVQDDLLELWEGTGKTVVFITHSLDEAVVLGDRVAVMTTGRAGIKTVLPIELAAPAQRDRAAQRSGLRRGAQGGWEALREEVLAARREAA